MKNSNWLERNGFLNSSSPDMGELAGSTERDVVVAYCSSIACAGAKSNSAKGIPILKTLNGKCTNCKSVAFMETVSCVAAKRHYEKALECQPKKKKRPGIYEKYTA